MDGMPCSVSAVGRTTATKRLPRGADSTREMADPTPTGTAMSRERAAISSGVTSAGMSETFVELYSHSNRLGVRYGTPFTRM